MRKVMLLAPENICGILRNALDPDYITLPCCDAGAAEAILGEKPDGLIICLFLPDMNGLTFLKTHCAQLPPVVMALTAFFDHDLLEKLQSLGVSDVTPVPCHLPKLLQKLEALMTKKCPSR